MNSDPRYFAAFADAIRQCAGIVEYRIGQPVVYVRCAYCGCSMIERAPTCERCGAPNGEQSPVR